MNKRFNRKRAVALIATIVLVAAMGGCSAPQSTSASTDGKTLVTEMCGRCHPVERVNGASKDQAGWTATVGRMRTNGLTVTDEQATAIVEYLTQRDAAK